MTLYYLATPYTNYPGGVDAAARDAARVASILAWRGWHILSPITHSHTFEIPGISPRDPDFWIRYNLPFMEKCDALIVAKMRGWQKSKGVAHEIGYFGRAGKPVLSVTVVYEGTRIWRSTTISALGELTEEHPCASTNEF